jgi:valyl-tRNA synthetase
VSAALKAGARQTLAEVLEAYLRLLHPLMPFITEEIWLSLAPLAGRSGDSIMTQPYPQTEEFPRDLPAEATMQPVQAIILGARQIRGQLDIPQSREIDVSFQTQEASDQAAIDANLAVIHAVGRIGTLNIVAADASLPPSSTAVVERRTISSPLAGLISDPGAERVRLAKRRAKLVQDLQRCRAKLSNENFMANAPAEIVAQENERVAQFEREIAQLQEQEALVGTL